ncbi:hypothetical protein ACNHKD_13650 [Methylocystis sp. JAN1]|uniref:hypothetical protein n=1 Tax=Methylocystis sp. JAN1 TaxID=3397211 RepID=UPI003FA221CD
MAKKALALSAHCADAYTILADHAASGEERFGFRRNAVAAGEEALGKDFDEIVGAFWMVLETRPFMRAKANLASELWERGEKAAAIDEAQDMLRLNPNDNQGMRDYLAAWLAEAGRYDVLDFAGGWRTPEGALEWLGAILPDAAAKAQPCRCVKKPPA